MQHFTGVSDPYEAPENPDVVVDSEVETVEESVSKILSRAHRSAAILTAAARSKEGAL